LYLEAALLSRLLYCKGIFYVNSTVVVLEGWILSSVN